MTQHTDRFRAMDTEIDVIVEADARPVAAFLSVRLLFEQQEARFSRFLPGSALCRLNRGEAVTGRLFTAACRMAIEAHRATGGLFNPMVLPSLQEAGYAETFTRVGGGRPRAQSVPSPVDCLAIEGESVRLLAGQLDLGGMIKGWTVDLAVDLLAAESPAAFVNAGGDLRCAGSERALDGWLAAVEGPGGTLAWEGAITGAVATSSRMKRRWRTDSGTHAHHLIDPRTGLPAASTSAQVTVWGRETWDAECRAKAVLIGGPAVAESAVAEGYGVLALDESGTVTFAGRVPGWPRVSA